MGIIDTLGLLAERLGLSSSPDEEPPEELHGLYTYRCPACGITAATRWPASLKCLECNLNLREVKAADG